jgi:polyphosphate kinase
VTPPHPHDTSLFINRELSWLAFNERVLEEAVDSKTPLLERVKFAAIAASNLDEFFMVRVAGLQQAVEDGETSPDLSGLTPSQQLDAVRVRSQAFVAALYRLVTAELLPALASHGIRLLAYSDLNDSQRKALGAFFAEAVLPVLTPLAIDVSRPFPLLSSLSLNVAVLLDAAPAESDCRLAIVQVPAGLARLVRIAGADGAAFVPLEEIIRAHLPQLFPGQTILQSTMMRLARDAEMEFDDEGGRTQLELVERELKRRRRSDVVRLELEASSSPELVELIADQVAVTSADTFAVQGPIDLRVLMGLVELPGFQELRDRPLPPVDVLTGEQTDIFAILDDQDLLLHHPYECYDPVVALLAQAADDPDVLAIKQTLYRTSADETGIMKALIRAAGEGKQVVCIVELKARFDEEANIAWAQLLEDAGIHVAYGVVGLKTHAKLCLAVRRENSAIRRYAHIGTGNYNRETAAVYEDVGLLTADPEITSDVSDVFNLLTGYSLQGSFRTLLVAPAGLRAGLIDLIRGQASPEGHITMKLNSLVDPQMIDALYDASQAGARIELIVRSMCCLRPGVPGLSEGIRVRSIVGRFLEHSRLFRFGTGPEATYLFGSADLMQRNLDRRVEVLAPIRDLALRARFDEILAVLSVDDTLAWELNGDGTWISPSETGIVNSQARLEQSALARARRVVPV